MAAGKESTPLPKKYAAVAITRNGIQLARQLGERLAGTDVYGYAKYSEGLVESEGQYLFTVPVKELLPSLFSRYEGVILFFSLGAVVRLIAPLLQDKKTDPAIIAIDERGEHVISVLSGHLGGANALCLTIAKLLCSHPVITTASDVQGSFAVDLLGRAFGWKADSFDNMKSVSAALVNGEPVAVLQECGEPGWLPIGATLPEHVRLCSSVAELLESPFSAAILVTDRLLEAPEESTLLNRSVLYRPRSLVLGLGCNRGTSEAELEAVVRDRLNDLKLSLASVRNIATAQIKGDEAGLLSLCSKYGWELALYSPEQLNSIPIANPSDTVFRATGAYGVCEPAALLSSGAADWLLRKKKSGNVTIAVARVLFDGVEESL